MLVYEVYTGDNKNWPIEEIGKFNSMRKAKRATKELANWRIAIGKKNSMEYLCVFHKYDVEKNSIIRNLNLTEQYPCALRQQNAVKRFIKTGSK